LFIVQSVTLTIYAVVVWTQLPETVPPISKSKQTVEASSPKQFAFKHYAIFGLMVSTLPISFFYAQTETNYRIFAEHVFPNLVFILAFISTCKAILEIILQIFLVKWSERFSMAKIILISYACYTIAAVGFSYSTTILSLFFTLLFLVIGESIALNHLLRFVSEIAPHDKRGLYFSIYGIHWDISRTCGPIIGAVILSKLNGSILFYICASFLLVGGIVQALFVQSLERKKIVNHPTHNL
ncbi:MFS transporter, partial [Bacillus thuringiensis]